MKITSIKNTIVSVPYTHRETSTRVRRDGVTAVLVKISTDCGLVGWGESCPCVGGWCVHNKETIRRRRNRRRRAGTKTVRAGQCVVVKCFSIL